MCIHHYANIIQVILLGFASLLFFIECVNVKFELNNYVKYEMSN